MTRNNRQDRVECSNCESRCASQTLTSSLSAALLVEFRPESMNVLSFQPEIEVFDKRYRLQGLVRNFVQHFSCVIFNNFYWEFFDDLCQNTMCFDSLESLYQHSSQGWFFAVYVLDNFQNLHQNANASICNQTDAMNNDIVEQDNADRCENSKHQNEQPSVSDMTDINADNIFETSNCDVLNGRSSLTRNLEKCSIRTKYNESKRKYYAENKDKINKRRREKYAVSKCIK